MDGGGAAPLDAATNPSPAPGIVVDRGGIKEWTPVRRGKEARQDHSFSDPLGDRRLGRSKFWVLEEEEEADEVEVATPTTEEIIEAATREGFSIEEIVQANEELQAAGKVIYRGTHWIRMWSLFQKEEEKNSLRNACRILETLTMDVFAKHGWRFSNRLCF